MWEERVMTDPTEFDPGVKQSFAFHDKPAKSSTGFRVHQLLFSHVYTAQQPKIPRRTTMAVDELGRE